MEHSHRPHTVYNCALANANRIDAHNNVSRPSCWGVQTMFFGFGRKEWRWRYWLTGGLWKRIRSREKYRATSEDGPLFQDRKAKIPSQISHGCFVCVAWKVPHAESRRLGREMEFESIDTLRQRCWSVLLVVSCSLNFGEVSLHCFDFGVALLDF